MTTKLMTRGQAVVLALGATLAGVAQVVLWGYNFLGWWN